MTDTPAPNDISKIENIGCCDIDPQRCAGMCSYADLSAPVAAGGESLNWKRQKDTVFAWAAEHGFTPVESEIVDLLSALQQPPAPAVDLESLYKGNRHNETDYNQGWNDCIDHLAAQGIIKGVE
jgi:hypothetical protein